VVVPSSCYPVKCCSGGVRRWLGAHSFRCCAVVQRCNGGWCEVQHDGAVMELRTGAGRWLKMMEACTFSLLCWLCAVWNLTKECAAATVKKLGFFNPTKGYCLGYSKLRHIVSLYASGSSWTEA